MEAAVLVGAGMTEDGILIPNCSQYFTTAFHAVKLKNVKPVFF
jgi:hypothetical protein